MNVSCSICHENLSMTADCSATKCGHVFHKMCLAAWIQFKKTCPTCRTPSNRTELRRIYFSVSNESADERERNYQLEVASLKQELQRTKSSLNRIQRQMPQLVSIPRLTGLLPNSLLTEFDLHWRTV